MNRAYLTYHLYLWQVIAVAASVATTAVDPAMPDLLPIPYTHSTAVVKSG